jgi:cytochrome b561
MNELPVHLWLLNNLDGSTAGRFTWQAPVSFGQGALLQTSTNLTDWTTLGAVTNHGGAVTWRHYLSLPQRFFRVVPQ